MRPRAIAFVTLLPLLAAADARAGERPQPFSARVEGHLGGTTLTDGSSESGFNGGGTGSVALRDRAFYVQGDVFGDYADIASGLSNVGGGGHGGVVDLNKKLAEWEKLYNYQHAHGALRGKTPYEAMQERLR